MVKPTTSSGETSERSSEVKYTGVRKRKWGKWVSEIRLPNSRERIWLGSYDTPEKAARAFDAALYCLRGRNAKFNFPDNPPDIVGGQSLKSHEIQAVASRYANEDVASSSYNDHTPVDLHSQLMEQCTSSSSDGAVHVDSDYNNIDWSFLDMLDSNEGRSDFGLYSGLDNMGTDLYSPPPPPSTTTTTMDDNVDDQNSCESYSQFLWNF